VSTVGHFFVDPGGQGSGLLSAALFTAGAAAVYRREKDLVVLLAAPFALTLIATALHRYPFGGRMMLFLVPATLVLIAEGMVFVYNALPPSRRWAGALLAVVVFWTPLRLAAVHALRGHERQANRAVLGYFARNVKSGDAVVLNSEAQFPFWYYAQRYGRERVSDELRPVMSGGRLRFAYRAGQFMDNLLTDGKRPYALFRFVYYVYDDKGHFRQLLSSAKDGIARRLYADSRGAFLPSGRVWFFFSSMDPAAQNFVLYVLGRNGKRLKACERRGAAVYLYKLPRR
jgi:hypothetical protein